jgi:hypothetical protein
MSFHLHLNDATLPQKYIGVEEINGLKFYSVENLAHYSYNAGDVSSWGIGIDPERNTENTFAYMVIDTQYHDAFGHWVYESVGFLSAFHILKERYPDLKLHLREKKIYKVNICKFLGIKEEDIVYEINTGHASITFFPSPITSLLCKDVTHYDIYLDKLYDVLNIPESEMENTKDFVILPRQQKENVPANNRNVSYANITEYFKTNTKYTYSIIHTDDLDNFLDQIKGVKQGKTMVINDGSAFVVNAIYCRGKKIFINNSCHTRQHSENLPVVKKMLERIQGRNDLYWFGTEDEIINYIHSNT